MKEEPTQKSDWILLYENSSEIKIMKSGAQHRADVLNDICMNTPVRTRSDYQTICNDVDGFIKRELGKDPEVQKLIKYVNIEAIKEPKPLRELRVYVENFKPEYLFTNVKFNGDEWIVDHETIELFADIHHRKYAKTKNQKKRYKKTLEFCDFLNSLIDEGYITSKTHIVAAMKETETGRRLFDKYVPDLNFVLDETTLTQQISNQFTNH